jgi:hypothetical protein
MLNIVTLAPIPSASVMITIAANPGRNRSPRIAYRTSWRRSSMRLAIPFDGVFGIGHPRWLVSPVRQHSGTRRLSDPFQPRRSGQRRPW